jgi:hypothetical protein
MAGLSVVPIASRRRPALPTSGETTLVDGSIVGSTALMAWTSGAPQRWAFGGTG